MSLIRAKPLISALSILNRSIHSINSNDGGNIVIFLFQETDSAFTFETVLTLLSSSL